MSEAEASGPRFELPATITEGARNDTLYRFACSLQAKGRSDAEIAGELERANSERCAPPLDARELEAIAAHVTRDYQKGEPRPTTGPRAARDFGEAARRGAGVHLGAVNDNNVARAFADAKRDVLRWCEDRRIWYRYDGVRWVQCDKDGEALQEAFKVAKALRADANRRAEGDPEAAQRVAKSLGNYENVKYARPMLDAAKPLMAARAWEFDAEATDGLVNFPNGTLDLTGEFPVFREHRREDMITKVAGAPYNEGADASEWLCFIGGLGLPDGVDGFLQREFSRALDADTTRQRFYLVHGPTRSGKSTFTGALTRALGDYAASAGADAFARQSHVNASKPSPEIARLSGVRLVVMPEPERGMVLDASRVKSWTGGDPVTARALYQGEFTFKPRALLVWVCNDMPVVTDMSVFESGRACVVEFPRHIPEEDRDLTLARRLETPEGLSAVINWLVAGWRLRRADPGRPDPQAVRGATEAYHGRSDYVGEFLEERLERRAGACTKGGEVYDVYKRWCESSRCYPLGKQSFFSELEKRGYLTRRAVKVQGKTLTNTLKDCVLTVG